jgi:deoxyribodipyrimidine photo-lyase
MTERPALIWFRNDLRLADNPALSAAANSGRRLVALYVLDTGSKEVRAPGSASRWWLANSLRSLRTALGRLGVPLVLRSGPAEETLSRIVREHDIAAAFWSRRYGHAAALDARIEKALRKDGVPVETHGGALLFEPGTVLSKAGTPIKVFTPFWRTALARGEARAPLRAPKLLAGLAQTPSERLEDWELEPYKPDWAGGLRETWIPGEDGARARLAHFIDHALAGYADKRDRPDLSSTSRLSPHLRFGEISPHQLWHAARSALDRGDAKPRDVERFLAEIGWREFSYHLLHQFPDLATKNVQRRFDEFPWAHGDALLRRWQRGRTGFPLVDAGMRELWRTGFMHNRVRMVVASLLVKHLLIDWREGERWFWDTLVDADPANNPASWQWVAGSGADAAPYFRVFNPALQGEKFDPDGNYVRRWVPELAHLPAAAIHRPNRLDAPDYPEPVVDHAKARARALAAFDRVKSRE